MNSDTRTSHRALSRRSVLRWGLYGAAATAGTLALSGQAGAAAVTRSAQRAELVGAPTIRLIDAASRTTAATSPVSSRSQLVIGTYRPDASTIGPVLGTILEPHSGDFVVSRNGQVVENLQIDGSVELGSFSNVNVRNCLIRGTLATGTDTAFINAANENLRGALIEDCILLGRGNQWISALRGANYTVHRTEISNMSDGIGLTSALGNVTIEGCWIHNGYYMEWAAGAPGFRPQGGNYTHVDGIQFHRGKNYVIRGNTIGGHRVPGAHSVGLAALINTGDDLYNSALMIKQEVDSSAVNKIENVLIENNWLAGGIATINIGSGRGNTFDTTVIRNNRFIRSTWGSQMYILRPSGYGQISGNIFDDDSSLIPISRGV